MLACDSLLWCIFPILVTSVTQPLLQSPRLRTLGMSAEIASRLRTLIEEGELPPGARIDERAFSEMFDVSKTPLREALKVLVAEGLVLHRQYIGYRVAPLDLDELRATLETLHGLEFTAGELAAARLSENSAGLSGTTPLVRTSSRVFAGPFAEVCPGIRDEPSITMRWATSSSET